MPPRTLIVQQDPALRQAAAASLARAGHEVSFADTVREAERAVEIDVPHAMVIDIALPGEPAISLLRRLRADHGTRGMAIVVLSRQSSEDDRILGLEAGADDYIGAPFSEKELAARLASVLRRRGWESAEETLEIAGLVIEPEHLRVSAGNRMLALSVGEFRLLYILMQRAGRALSRAQLVDALKVSGSSLEERSVDAQVNRLRRALAPSGHDRLIETIAGIGYRFSSS